MEKKYISVDVETSGPTPGKYSMLSLGACIVGDTSVQFYRELKPLNHNYILEAMKVGCLGLYCCKCQSNPEYYPKFESFNPEKVLKLLSEIGEEPSKAMSDFSDWVNQNTNGFEPVEAAAPIKFDGMFTAWYFDNFYPGKNPLGYSGVDIKSMYRGWANDENASTKNLVLGNKQLPHNALEDAIIQAKEFEIVLKKMNSCLNSPIRR